VHIRRVSDFVGLAKALARESLQVLDTRRLHEYARPTSPAPGTSRCTISPTERLAQVARQQYAPDDRPPPGPG
jgi:hypothetical protein